MVWNNLRQIKNHWNKDTLWQIRQKWSGVAKVDQISMMENKDFGNWQTDWQTDICNSKVAYDYNFEWQWVDGDKLAATKIDLGKQLGNNCNVYWREKFSDGI